MFKQIEFQNYKAFAEQQVIEFRPLTILLGKNSSGKSSICKLIMCLAEAFSGNSANLLPLKVGEGVVSGRYEDLFHDHMFARMSLGVTNTNYKRIQIDFAMTDGRLVISNYRMSDHNDLVKSIELRNRQQFESTNFTGLIQPESFEEKGWDKNTFKQDTTYIGPIRKFPPRYIRNIDFNGDGNVKYSGGNAYSILLNSYQNDHVLFDKVSNWFEKHMEGQRLDFVEVGNGSGTFELNVIRGHAHVNITDVGEGVGQVLPIIVQSYIPNVDMTIIEQPSLHLNPAAHPHVAYRLASSAKEFGKCYVVETHSNTFLLGLKKLIASRKNILDRDDVVIYYVDHDGEDAYLMKITLNENLEYTDWPTGLFEDDYNLLNDINNELL